MGYRRFRRRPRLRKHRRTGQVLFYRGDRVAVQMVGGGAVAFPADRFMVPRAAGEPPTPIAPGDYFVMVETRGDDGELVDVRIDRVRPPRKPPDRLATPHVWMKSGARGAFITR